MEVERNRFGRQPDTDQKPNWGSCQYCKNTKFKELHNFTRHLRTEHCSVEGGSFVCRYGYNSVCNSLPVEGVSDLDYADHIMKHHAFTSVNSENGARRKWSNCSEKSMASGTSDTPQWTSMAPNQNLAAVLNDPGRGKQRDFFTKLWGVDFVDIPLSSIAPNPNLQLVTRAHFEAYLRKISKRHRRHEQLHQQLPETQQLSGPRRRIRSIERRIEPLDIPSIFLQSDLDLSRPTVFYSAIPFAKAGITVDGTFRQNSKLLQEKLAQSLDQVEMRIAEQVADKSEAFFTAMTTHDSLMDQLGKILIEVRSLRSLLNTVDTKVARKALHLLRLQQRRANHVQVLLKLKLMRTLHQTQPQIQMLLSAPDYVAALELIGSSQEILDNDLTTIRCFRNLQPQLSEITSFIDKMMASEFESYSTRDLNRPLTGDTEVLEQEKLVCIMLGMLRRGSTSFIGQYEKEAFTAIRAQVKQVALERLAESDCEGHGPFTERIQSLSLNHFLQLIHSATVQLFKLLTKIKGVHDVMKATLEMAAGVKSSTNDVSEADSFSFLNEKDLEKGMGELQRLLTAVCSFAHEECAKLISNASALESASASQFGRLGQVVDRFYKECCEISGRGPAALRAAFQVAAGRFVTRFHKEHKEQLTSLLDLETWRSADVPSDVQQLVDSLVAKQNFSDLFELPSEGSKPFFTVGSDKFTVVGSAVTLLRMIAEYADLARSLTLLGFHILRDLVELLKLFNSRSCQLVLFAGAVKTANLKTITSTMLVLTSRTLQFFVCLMPHVRNHFEDAIGDTSSKNGKLPIANLVEGVEGNMTDHITQLHDKVVFVVGQVVTTELSSWAAKPPVPSQAFQKISGHLQKLHKAVSEVLPPNQIEALYRRINDQFKSALREQVRKLNINNNGGPQHGVVTSELVFYIDMLEKLNVLPSDDISNSAFDQIWETRGNQ